MQFHHLYDVPNLIAFSQFLCLLFGYVIAYRILVLHYFVKLMYRGDQKFPNTITFLQITVTSSIFNQFVHSLACLITRNVYYIVYKFYLNWLRIEKATIFRKNVIKFKNTYFLYVYFVDRLLVRIRIPITRAGAIIRC